MCNHVKERISIDDLNFFDFLIFIVSYYSKISLLFIKK